MIKMEIRTESLPGGDVKTLIHGVRAVEALSGDPGVAVQGLGADPHLHEKIRPKGCWAGIFLAAAMFLMRTHFISLHA